MGSGGGGWWGLQGPKAAWLLQLGLRSPGDKGGMCWHLVSAKRVRGQECSIGSGTGLEQRGSGVHCEYLCRGWKRGGVARWITQSCLPWRCGSSMANSRLESMSFPNEAPECCMLNKIYLSICAFMQGAGSPGHGSQYATSAWNSPLGSCLFFSPSCGGLQDQALRGWDEWLPV